MSEPPADRQTLEQARQEIRQLVEEIAQLSRRDVDVETYFQKFLEGVVGALAAAGGAVWTRGEAGEPNLVTQINLRVTEIADGGDDEVRHRRLLRRAMASGESIVTPPYSGSDDVGNPTRFLLIVVPLCSDDAVEGVVEVFQRPGASIDVQRGYLKFLHGVCERAGDWIRRRQFRQVSRQQEQWRKLDEFSQVIHESLHSRETAFAVANEARPLIACDRVSVATRRGGKLHLEAISGQDSIDRRSNVVVLLQKLVRRVAAAGDPFWYAGSTEDVAPQIEEALQQYVDFAHTKTIGVIPLRRAAKDNSEAEDDAPGDDAARDEGEIVGVLIVEQIEDTTSLAAVQQRTAAVAPHAARALTNAYDHESLFLMPLWRAIGRSRVLVEARNLPKTLLVAGLLLLVVVVCLFVKIRFELEGPAELQPVQRRNIFAGVEGVVTEVHVDTGDQVDPGDPLVTLRNSDLMVRLEELEGQLQIATEQVMDYERKLLGGAGATASERAHWASEMVQARKQLISLDAQQRMLLEKKRQLTVTSPIAGEVITWDVRRLLNKRTVMPGQILMTVANPRGEWELIVHMPEDNIGYVTDAQAKMKEELDANYVLATNPGEKLQGHIREQGVHHLAEPHETAGHSVNIVLDIDEDDLQHPRPGATATAQIDCGRRSIAFVWLHDVVEFIQRKVLF